MGKLPYIPDKKLYAAVMGACSWIRADGYFNKAVNYYADKYDVSAEDVAKYVRIAQGNGQREANKRNPRKYYYYALEYDIGGAEDWYEDLHAKYKIVKATSSANAKKQLGYYSPRHYNDFMAFTNKVEGFSTKEEAINCAKKWNEERKGRLREIYAPEYWAKYGIE